MSVSDKDRKNSALTFVLPPPLTQHDLPAGIERGKRPAARMEGSCNNSTPRTLNNCFYRTRGPLSPE
ncbi:MAG: hypothetical protein K2Y27_19430 [Xanthobacteraceae bacterium]|nr:hypothetical protein [Xanthobacteraceae bacterium]